MYITDNIVIKTKFISNALLRVNNLNYSFITSINLFIWCENLYLHVYFIKNTKNYYKRIKNDFISVGTKRSSQSLTKFIKGMFTIRIINNHTTSYYTVT